MKRQLAALALIALAATGCGGGSKKTASLGSSPSPSATASSESTPAGTAGFNAKCLAIAQQFAKSGEGLSASTTPADRSAAFANLAAEFTALKSGVSDQKVKDALDELASAYASLGRKLKSVGNYTPGSGQTPPAAYLDAIRAFTDPKYAAAAKVLSGYFGGACKG